MTTTEETAKPIRLCCPEWARLGDDRRDQWAWQALHELCHGRVPFRLDWFAEVARVTPRQARTVLREARDEGWWAPAEAQHLGQLRRKR